uniref:Small ribosomal subunit protein uS13c n=1 Tax=Melanthalia intermedia TaxID=172989 RepID=A0A345UAW7_9FLOR|nr:ribosomal protein S13 [Melanthalia intermedia]AXI97603.1 ribosomal protein S13 [Melanthalia intermedia]
MTRIAGVDLPKNKRIEIGLTYIYGIGKSKAQKILRKINIDLDTKTNRLTDKQIISIKEILSKEHEIEGDLRRLRAISIKRLIEIGSYKGRRHGLDLPLRGQRTRTNARTKRSGRKTMTGKKKAPRK